jgi:hypothetical protein
MVEKVIGWVLSGVIAVLGSMGLWFLSQPPRVSAPSGVFPNLMSKVALPIDPKSVSPVPMAGDCDAGEKYRAAINELLANRREYDAWFEKANTAVAAKPRAVELIAEASDCSKMTLFRKTPSEVITYDPEPATLEAIQRLGEMTLQRGMLLRKTAPDEARHYLAAAFALGRHLFEERVAWREFTAGVNLMVNASKYLAEIEPDPAKATYIQNFAAAADKYKLDQLKLYGAINTTDADLLRRHGGDAFALARGSPEPMWRTSAILALGRMKYNTPLRGDQLAAPRELKGWLNDTDPTTRAAAEAASNLTLEQYRMLR